MTWYAASDGAGVGTIGSPFSLTDAATNNQIPQGATVYLRGGTYTPNADVTFSCRGVTYTPYPGEKPIIETLHHLIITADNVTFTGLIEYRSPTRNRVSAQAGSDPTDISIPHIYPQGKNFTLAGGIIHDMAGFFVQSGADNVVLMDTLIVNPGWLGPDRGHGHTYYGHGNSGQITTLQNVIFAQAFGDGIEWYSGSQQLIGLHVSKMIEFSSNGSHIGGESASTVDDVVFDHCATWDCGQDFGYLSSHLGSLTRTNCYDAVDNPLIRGGWASVTQSGNTWATGTPDKVIVNQCSTPGTVAHFAIFNWSQANTVTVDLTSTSMVNGQQYRLRDCFDPYGAASTFVYNGSSITIDMTSQTVAIPTGYTDPLITRDKRFGAFRIEQV